MRNRKIQQIQYFTASYGDAYGKGGAGSGRCRISHFDYNNQAAFKAINSAEISS